MIRVTFSIINCVSGSRYWKSLCSCPTLIFLFVSKDAAPDSTSSALDLFLSVIFSVSCLLKEALIGSNLTCYNGRTNQPTLFCICLGCFKLFIDSRNVSVDGSRVLLRKDGKDTADYINASFVKVLLLQTHLN